MQNVSSNPFKVVQPHYLPLFSFLKWRYLIFFSLMTFQQHRMALILSVNHEEFTSATVIPFVKECIDFSREYFYKFLISDIFCFLSEKNVKVYTPYLKQRLSSCLPQSFPGIPEIIKVHLFPSCLPLMCSEKQDSLLNPPTKCKHWMNYNISGWIFILVQVEIVPNPLERQQMMCHRQPLKVSAQQVHVLQFP